MHVDETQSIKPRFPPEADYGLWGGEGIIKGFTKRTKRMERYIFVSSVGMLYLLAVTLLSLERRDGGFPHLDK